MAGEETASEHSDLRPTEKCGIIGCAGTSSVTADLYYGLRILQHRGQESAGIAVHDGETKAKRGMGLVHEVFTKEDIMDLRANSGIGHVRYSTTGTSVIENAQPIVVRTSYGDIALAHNGDIANAMEIREELSKKGWAFMTTSDSEVIVRLLANEMVNTGGDVHRALKEFTNRLVGAYSLALMINGTVYAVRDPLAVRPLCIGEGEGRMMIASESVVFDALGFKFLRDLKPGEIVELRPDGFESMRLPHPNHTAHCMFEWVYFARPDSVLDERLVYDARVKIGEQLAREYPIDADIIVPVPESGRAQAQGYAQVSGLPVVEGLIKNRYIERTFIMPDQQDREVGVMLKLNPIRSAVKGRRVVLIDDSIVRGTTIRKIVQILRQAGAREVHVRIGCPPIRFPCYLGIDMKTRDQFIANEKTVPEIVDFITADSVGYLSLKGLITALKHPRADMCIGCLTGEYPVPIPGEKLRKERPLEVFGEHPPKNRKEPASSVIP
ncbi:MAG TPA: amidophosphoribosyltransferase [Thermoplasmata archaeon]|nr:amidophosphoribosyltransferase [Thermoplasmata archaeon]